MNINDTFKSLKQADKDYLMAAFDDLISRYVKLDNNRFIGCHCGDELELNVEETNGYWFCGTVKNANIS